MSLLKKSVLMSAAIGVAATMAMAQSNPPGPMERAVKARQAQMVLYAYNMGILGAMAKGDVAYDSAAAGKAAGNIAALAALDMSTAWPKGTDNFDMDGTRALPAMWLDDPAKVAKMSSDMIGAASAFSAVAGTDLAALRGGLGNVGQTCGACHKLYRSDQ